ncbi:MAG: 5'-3' exonuclease [Lentisphaeria bacterium]|nr:5'-3' exonuclease [Lentisphaeria bacterium]
MSGENSILLVDGYSQIYRAYFAIRGLTAPDGQPSNALFGMARFLLTLDQQLPHAYAALVLDKGKPRHRIELLPAYKATRPPMPDDLRSQVPPICDWARAMGWRVLQADGFEADDLIAVVVDQRGGRDVAIVSHDKDLGQLVQPGVALVQPGSKGSMKLVDPAAITEKFGVPPHQLVDYLALVGDTVDNIPGVPGVGSKTAAILLRRFGSIDGILADLDRIERPGLREGLRQSEAILQRNRSLVALRRTPPPDWEGMEALRRGKPDWSLLLETALRFGFGSMTAEIRRRIDEDRNPRLL